MIEARIEGSKLIITADLEHPVPSKSGKTLVVASSRGIVTTEAKLDGKLIKVGFNAFYNHG